MKTKLPIATRILTAFSIILILTLPVLYVNQVFAADVALPFQDGFESGDFTKWSAIAGGSVTSGGAHHGTYKAVFSSGYVQAQFAPVDQCFMRAYVMFKAFPIIATDCTVFGIWKASSPSRYMAEVRVANVGGIVKWRMRYYDSTGYFIVTSEQQKPVLDTWYCVEVKGKSNTLTNAESRVYVNGNELTDITQTGKSNDLQINQVYIWISGSATTTIWYDDVVIDTAYIGPETYTLTTSVSPVGSGSVSKSPDQATYDWGTNVALTAHENLGWTFASWSGGASGTSNPVTITITDTTAVTATFIQVAAYVDPALTEKTISDIGTSFQVSMKITGFIDLQGFDIKMAWDNSLITLSGGDYTIALDNMWGIGNWEALIHEAGPGYYKLVAVSTAASFTGAGPLPLCTLTLTVQDPQSSLPIQTAIHFETHKFSDSQADPITHVANDGTYRISGPVPALQMSPTGKTCRKYGETFTIQASVSDAFDVTDFEFEIRYDTTLLDYSSITWNAWGSGSIDVDEVSGIVTGSTSGDMLIGDQLLITIEFRAAYYRIWKDESKVPGWENDQSGLIYIQSAKLSYPSGPDLSYVRGGSSNQINMGSDFTYTFSPIKGDVDNNGVVDVFDLRTVAFYYDQANTTYDLNGDGIIDLFDLVIIGSNFGFSYP